MTKTNVLIIGGGGREHALAWKIAQSPRVGRLFVAPGNGGTHGIATNVDLAADDVSGLVAFALKHKIGLTVVGPDDSLAVGVVDAFTNAGLRIFGPTRAAAQIEASKAFSKELMTSAGIPTARYKTFTQISDATEYLTSQRYPVVVKASGLALGKGVSICANKDEAESAVHALMESKIFGSAGNEIVIEEYLSGQEVSIHAFCDGKTAVLFPSAQDHKAIFDGDNGPNTGGMGTISPVPWVSPELLSRAKSEVVEPILSSLAAAGSPFVGLLYPGLMVSGGDINVLEFNARFGDPETQSYMRLLVSDLLDILDACVDGTLSEQNVQWSGQTAVTVVLASGGYPGGYGKGQPITGVSAAAAQKDVVIFHAGTQLESGKLVTSGGRVLAVSAIGADLAEAQHKAYAAVKLINFEGMQYRSDIGAAALKA